MFAPDTKQALTGAGLGEINGLAGAHHQTQRGVVTDAEDFSDFGRAVEFVWNQRLEPHTLTLCGAQSRVNVLPASRGFLARCAFRLRAGLRRKEGGFCIVSFHGPEGPFFHRAPLRSADPFWPLRYAARGPQARGRGFLLCLLIIPAHRDLGA